MIAQIIGFTRHLLKDWNIISTEVVSCKFKDQVRARQSGEKWGLGPDSQLPRLCLDIEMIRADLVVQSRDLQYCEEAVRSLVFIGGN